MLEFPTKVQICKDRFEYNRCTLCHTLYFDLYFTKLIVTLSSANKTQKNLKKKTFSKKPKYIW